MPAAVWERFASRSVEADDSGTTMTTLWDIYGTNNELEARWYLGQQAPAIYYDSVNLKILFRKSHDVDQVGDRLFEGTVVYASPEVDSGSGPPGGGGGSAAEENGGFHPDGNAGGGPPPTPPPAGCRFQFSFDTTAAQSHITNSLATISRKGPGSFVPPDMKGAIGVKEDSDGKVEVEGVDIYFPSLKWSETHSFAASFVTPTYVKTLASLTATVNAGNFRNFAAGEVIFLGASGQSQEDGRVPVTFSFEASQNVTGLDVAGINGIDKKGWEYLWIAYEDAEDATTKKTIARAFGAYVEQVYKTADWSGLALPC